MTWMCFAAQLRCLALLLLTLFVSAPVSAQSDNLTKLMEEVVRLYGAGRYADAVPLAEHALNLAERLSGPDHHHVATALNNLAELYMEQNRHAEAERMLVRSLSIREKALGREHSEVGAALNSLGRLFSIRGDYEAAELAFKRSLGIWEKEFGIDHPNVATVIHNLAAIYRMQDRYADAEPLYKRSLAIMEKALGPDDPAVAETLNDLSLLYFTQYRYADAEPLYKRSLAIMEKALGPDHPGVATIVSNLAALYRAQSRYTDAEPLYRRSLIIWEQQLGPDHRNVAAALNNLALLYKGQGRYADAEPLYKRSLAIVESALGTDHQTFASSLNNLGALYFAQGRYAEADPLFKRSLAVLNNLRDPNGLTIAKAANNLAELYSAQERYSDAEPLHQRSLAMRERALGSDHPDVAVALGNLAALYDRLERPAEAAVLRARAEAIPGWEVADVPVLFATNRFRDLKAATPKFGNDQQVDLAAITFGRAIIRAPKSEVVNRAERGAQTLGQLHNATGRQTSEAALSVHSIDLSPNDGAALVAPAKDRLTRAARFPKQGLIYVHGYNNTFDDALRRAAQIGYDLDFDGLIATFAWPARGGVVTTYVGDRDRAATAAPFLLHMIETLGQQFPDVKFHIIGHSTGGEVILNALERLADRSTAGPRAKLGEVILAHADVNTSRLAAVMPNLRKLGVAVTSYSSNEDRAMKLSDWLRGDGARVGGAPVHLDGVQAIDISGLGLTFSWNHNTFVNNSMVFGDMARLMSTGERSPTKRTPYFVPVTTPKGTHWEFRAPKL